MKKYVWLLILIGILIPHSVLAESDQPRAVLNVIVLYDRPGEENDEGVGSGTIVKIRESGSLESFLNLTDDNSATKFSVFYRTYIVEAFPPQTRLFFRWVCLDSVFVDSPDEYLILECQEKFFVHLPWSGY